MKQNSNRDPILKHNNKNRVRERELWQRLKLLKIKFFRKDECMKPAKRKRGKFRMSTDNSGGQAAALWLFWERDAWGSPFWQHPPPLRPPVGRRRNNPSLCHIHSPYSMGLESRDGGECRQQSGVVAASSSPSPSSVQGVKVKALCLLSKNSTTKLYLQPWFLLNGKVCGAHVQSQH